MRDVALALVLAFALYVAWPAEGLLLTPEPARLGLRRWRLLLLEGLGDHNEDPDSWVAVLRESRGLVPGSTAAPGRARRPAGAHRKVIMEPVPVETHPRTLPPPAPPATLEERWLPSPACEGHPPWDTAAPPPVCEDTMVAPRSAPPADDPPTLVRQVRANIEDDLAAWLEDVPRLAPGE